MIFNCIVYQEMFSKHFGLALASSLLALSAQGAVFVVAHPDDDVLMMGPNLIQEIRRNAPTVIIVVTAGDAGKGPLAKLPQVNEASQTSFNDHGNPYYRVRLMARERALDAMMPADKPRQVRRAMVDLGANTRQVEQVTIGNVTEYRLNLPDQVEWASTFTTMQKLRDDPNFVTHDVERGNTYDRATLRRVIRKIIRLHNRNMARVAIHYQEPAPVNPRLDHADHSAAGALVKSAIEEQPLFRCVRQAIYPGYPAAAVLSSDQKYFFPKLVDAQKAAYESLHAVLRDYGNISPLTGAPVNMGTPAGITTAYPSTAQGIQRQRGTMDEGHTRFYGKAKWHEVASSGPCDLSKDEA